MTKTDNSRKADLAAIHIAKAKLGWDEDMYRDVLFSVCRVKSSAELDYTGRKTFLAHLRACAGSPPVPPKPVRTPLTPTQKKMWALWQQLADQGKLTNRKMPALLAYIKRQTGVDRLEWLKFPQEDLVIESLKAWLKRADAPALVPALLPTPAPTLASTDDTQKGQP